MLRILTIAVLLALLMVGVAGAQFGRKAGKPGAKPVRPRSAQEARTPATDEQPAVEQVATALDTAQLRQVGRLARSCKKVAGLARSVETPHGSGVEQATAVLQLEQAPAPDFAPVAPLTAPTETSEATAEELATAAVPETAPAPAEIPSSETAAPLAEEYPTAPTSPAEAAVMAEADRQTEAAQEPGSIVTQTIVDEAAAAQPVFKAPQLKAVTPGLKQTATQAKPVETDTPAETPAVSPSQLVNSADASATPAAEQAAVAPPPVATVNGIEQQTQQAALDTLKVLNFTGDLAAKRRPAEEAVPADATASLLGGVDENAAALEHPSKTSASGESAVATDRGYQPGSRSEPPDDKNADQRDARRPKLKTTKRAAGTHSSATDTESDAADAAADPAASEAAAAELDVADPAAAAMQSVIGTAGTANAAPSDQAEQASVSTTAQPAGDFTAPFVPRDSATSLAQLESGNFNAPAPAAAQAQFSLPPAGDAGAPTAVSAMLDTPLSGSLPTLGGAAPVSLMLGTMDPAWRHFELPKTTTEIARGNPKRKQIALTFDDGPHPEATSQLLAILRYYDVPATFFFTGLQAQKYPNWVKMAYLAGHEIGNHTYDHFRIPKLPRQEQEYQIDEYQRLIKGLTGASPRFLRPPGGQIDKATVQLVAQRGMAVAMWDVNLNDVKTGKSAHELLQTSLKKIRPGSIVLAHDGIQSTVDMLPELIVTLRAEGYTFVTMSELASGIK